MNLLRTLRVVGIGIGVLAFTSPLAAQEQGQQNDIMVEATAPQQPVPVQQAQPMQPVPV